MLGASLTEVMVMGHRGPNSTSPPSSFFDPVVESGGAVGVGVGIEVEGPVQVVGDAALGPGVIEDNGEPGSNTPSESESLAETRPRW